MLRTLTCLAVLLPATYSQTTLESVSIEGTNLSRTFVLDIAGLQIDAPIDQAAIEAACAKLRDSGLFSSIAYRYTAAPDHGYALALTVADQGSLSDAAIDVPGIDENEAWAWLASQYPSFHRKVPGNDAAQQFLARKLEQHLGAQLEGQHLVARLESELMPRRRTIISFQPETLPRIASMSFTGQHQFTAAQLAALLEKAVAGRGFMERHFREAVELNLRSAYETRGMYRVRFPSITAQKTSSSEVAVTTSIEEGPQYTLGDVQFVGDHLPLDAMVQAAQFLKGAIADWDQIQQGIWESERPVKRAGFLSAKANPQRAFDDENHVLNLQIPFTLGPLYHFGKLTISGLPQNLEARIREQWKLQPGDPFDYSYGSEFMNEFVRNLGDRPFKRFSVRPSNGSGQYVMDYTLAFEPR